VFRVKSVGRGGRLIMALVAGAAVFGVVSAVQAAIPDSNGVVHGCYFPVGTGKVDKMTYLRVIDTDKGQHCGTGENSVDLVGSGTVQNDSYYAEGGPVNGLTTPVTITSVAIPAGNFTVSASGVIAVGTAVGAHLNTRCSVNGFLDQNEDGWNSIWPASSNVDQAPFAIDQNVVGPKTVTLQCTSSAAGTLDGGRIVVTRVGTLHQIAPVPPIGPAPVNPGTTYKP
jgi:hypothetical protein